MDEIKKYMDKIVKKSDAKDMKKVAKMFYSMFDEVDDDVQDEIKTELYEIINGKKLNKKMAEKWVEEMQPAGKWSMDEVKELLESKGIDEKPTDLFVAMNMIFSDYGEVIKKFIPDEDDMNEFILEMAKAYLKDEDGGKSKLYDAWKMFNKAKKSEDEETDDENPEEMDENDPEVKERRMRNLRKRRSNNPNEMNDEYQRRNMDYEDDEED